MSIHTSATLFQSGDALQTKTSTHAGIKILFVGDNRGDFSSLQSFFERRGGHCSFVRSAREGLVLFGPNRFDVILDMTPHSNHSALTTLGCPNCSVFRRCQVEIGSLWLPVITRGEECFGSAALRPKEFIALLEKTVAEPAYKVKAACQ